MKKLAGYLVQGALFIAPLAITVYILWVIFRFFDGLLETLLTDIGFYIPGLGIVIILILLVLIGFLGQTIIARPVKMLMGKLFDKVPLLKIIYSAFNDLLSAFVGKQKKFSNPVLVLVNEEARLEKVGFLTEKDLSLLEVKDKVAVYFPHSYNFSGELFIVPVKNIKPLKANPAQVMKFVVSAGVSGFEKEEQLP
ncbi:DUF502 domain-containing protein [Saccharicrinis sp. FJH54]|uniref:DUF502 domain-containing protein n=1 Tax=Saccharicrinis sp. FJH54 TaxID=3344665 RepID=UPI0035D4DFA9